MRLSIQFFIISFLVFLAGCSKDLEPVGLSDAEIIQMIQSSEMVEISMSDLPIQSQTLVEQDYYDYMDVATKRASGLGYEVELAGMGHRLGLRNEVYFNLEGRKLDPNDWGDKRGWDRDGYDRGFGVNSEQDWRCFDLILPITFEMPDGSAIIVESDDEDGWAQIKSWYEENPDSQERPLMQFPIVAFYEDESITLNSSEELRDAYSRCRLERDKNDWRRSRGCFSLVYPVTFIMPDGSTMDVTNDDESGWANLKNWYAENTGYEEVMPEINYPVDIVYETENGDSTVTLNTAEEMELAKRECWGDWEDGDESGGEDDWGENEDNELECFSLVYPVTFIMPDGSLFTLSEEADWRNLELWYEQNSEVEAEPVYQFPVDIVYETEDGQNTVTINNQEEMETAEEECWGDDE